MPGSRFYLADGTYLGEAGDEVRAGRAQLHGATPEPAEAERAGDSARANSSDPGHGATPQPAEAERAEDSARANSSEPEPAKAKPGASCSEPESSEVEDAIKAVHRMGIPKKQARAWVVRVVERSPGRVWTAGDLVRELLVASRSADG